MLWFGTGPSAEFRAGSGLKNAVWRVRPSNSFLPQGSIRLELPLIGRHNVMNGLAALAACGVWGLGLDDAKRVFSTLMPADKRGEVVPFDEGFCVINDSYNSSPTALNAVVDWLAAARGYQRRILATGEMRELGECSAELHRECGRAAGRKRLDWIFGVQGHAADFLEGAVEAGHPRDRTQYFENSEEAAKFLEGFLAQGDLLLVKGSRGVRMEKILEAVGQNPWAIPGEIANRTLEGGMRGTSLKCFITSFTTYCGPISVR